jgi:hypothetical protein
MNTRISRSTSASFDRKTSWSAFGILTTREPLFRLVSAHFRAFHSAYEETLHPADVETGRRLTDSLPLRLFARSNGRQHRAKERRPDSNRRRRAAGFTDTSNEEQALSEMRLFAVHPMQ